MSIAAPSTLCFGKTKEEFSALLGFPVEITLDVWEVDNYCPGSAMPLAASFGNLSSEWSPEAQEELKPGFSSGTDHVQGAALDFTGLHHGVMESGCLVYPLVVWICASFLSGVSFICNSRGIIILMNCGLKSMVLFNTYRVKTMKLKYDLNICIYSC